MHLVAILCGGLGTRLGDLTRDTPKCLLEVAGKPFLVHQLERLRERGAQRVLLCCRSGGNKIWRVVGDGSGLRMTIHYTFDGPYLRGTGGALHNARYQLSNPFWYLYGDVLLDADFEYIETLYTGNALMLIANNPEGRERSNVQFRMGKVLSYSKRLPTATMHHLDAGAGLLAPTMLLNHGEVFDLSAVLSTLALQGRVDGVRVEMPHEIGSFEGLEATRSYLEQHT